MTELEKDPFFQSAREIYELSLDVQSGAFRRMMTLARKADDLLVCSEIALMAKKCASDQKRAGAALALHMNPGTEYDDETLSTMVRYGVLSLNESIRVLNADEKAEFDGTASFLMDIGFDRDMIIAEAKKNEEYRKEEERAAQVQQSKLEGGE